MQNIPIAPRIPGVWNEAQPCLAVRKTECMYKRSSLILKTALQAGRGAPPCGAGTAGALHHSAAQHGAEQPAPAQRAAAQPPFGPQHGAAQHGPAQHGSAPHGAPQHGAATPVAPQPAMGPLLPLPFSPTTAASPFTNFDPSNFRASQTPQPAPGAFPGVSNVGLSWSSETLISNKPCSRTMLKDLGRDIGWTR